jgi:hypothetical protein
MTQLCPDCVPLIYYLIMAGNGVRTRVPNGILGLLIRNYYPGIVKYKGKDVPACNWRHYNVVPEPASSGGQPINALQQVVEKFWVRNIKL